jgi:hypothetical protein
MAVSGLQPQGQGQQQQQFTGVPPPGSQPKPTFLAKAKGPFMGLTLIATVAMTTLQSKRMYKRRQSSLLDEFGETMVRPAGGTARICLRPCACLLVHLPTAVPLSLPGLVLWTLRRCSTCRTTPRWRQPSAPSATS